jgi:hypothetical protein
MKLARSSCVLFCALGILSCAGISSAASSADEILKAAEARVEPDSLRASIGIETLQGAKTVSEHHLWLLCKFDKKGGALVLDFTEPEESKDLRFLLWVKETGEPEAYMHLPAAGKTLPVDANDPKTDIGGTGLTVGDFQPLMRREGDVRTLVGEKDLDGKPCNVIEVSRPDTKEKRVIWISKDRNDLVKLEQLDADGRPERSLRVIEFFETRDGRRLPREEHISLPKKGTTIKVRQENAVFAVDFPEGLFDPEKFGTLKWRH